MGLIFFSKDYSEYFISCIDAMSAVRNEKEQKAWFGDSFSNFQNF